jgi:sugar O-acyltransferase (sialic acid O-acetyltransferase NeuD family)
MSRLVIYGCGGFGQELVRSALHALACDAGLTELCFASDTASPPILGFQVISPSDFRPDDQVVLAIGSSGTRQRLAPLIPNAATVIAPTAVIGPNVTIGEGAVFCDFTMITASARIGRHFQCNIYSYVAHDCVIGDFVTFGPRVCCNGNVLIGDGAHIGSGANIRNGSSERPLHIGEGAFVGMGAVVTKDVAAGATVVGNPARPLRTAEIVPLRATASRAP